MNSLLDILFFTWGELRSTESRIREKHITYLIRVIVIIRFDHHVAEIMGGGNGCTHDTMDAQLFIQKTHTEEDKRDH